MEVRRKDGINYFRREKDEYCDARYLIRLNSEKFETFKKIAKQENKKASELLREIMDDYLESKKVEL